MSIVPEGQAAWADGRTYREGQVIWSDDARFFLLEEHVQVIVTEHGKYVLKWMPDPENLGMLVANGDEEGVTRRVEAILDADPLIDIREYEQNLGVVITSIRRPEVRTLNRNDICIIGRLA